MKAASNAVIPARTVVIVLASPKGTLAALPFSLGVAREDCKSPYTMSAARALLINTAVTTGAQSRPNR